MPIDRASPARYPKNHSYRKLYEAHRAAMLKEQLAAKEKKPVIEDDFIGTKKFRFQSGANLSITRKEDKSLTYVLRLADGQSLVIERTAVSASLFLTNAEGKTVKTLGCEI